MHLMCMSMWQPEFVGIAHCIMNCSDLLWVQRLMLMMQTQLILISPGG